MFARTSLMPFMFGFPQCAYRYSTTEPALPSIPKNQKSWDTAKASRVFPLPFSVDTISGATCASNAVIAGAIKA